MRYKCSNSRREDDGVSKTLAWAKQVQQVLGLVTTDQADGCRIAEIIVDSVAVIATDHLPSTKSSPAQMKEVISFLIAKRERRFQ